MKKTIVVVASLIYGIMSFAQCPIYGDGKNRKDQVSDSLKNRSMLVGVAPEKINIDVLTSSTGTDAELILQKKFVSIEGYIFDAKWGGLESCQCHTKDKDFYDVHIEIVKDINVSDKTKRIICEVTRFSRKTNPELSYENIKKFIGKKVIISGYMFYDGEHKQNSANTSKSQTNVWRASCWEVHPVESIQEIK